MKGEQILLGARILAIAEAFDAMTSDHPYRTAQSISSAKREIERQSEKQFDPEIVKVFHSIPEHIWQDVRAEIDAQSRTRRYGFGKTAVWEGDHAIDAKDTTDEHL